ncbi:MAG: hypothetical protein FWE70_03615 [Oscillospiraceae bacterium]|nr:hypothetical protein [Oscillospiraceae bacterium]
MALYVIGSALIVAGAAVVFAAKAIVRALGWEERFGYDAEIYTEAEEIAKYRKDKAVLYVKLVGMAAALPGVALMFAFA